LEPAVAGEFAICFANEYSPDTKLLFIDVGLETADESNDDIDNLVQAGDTALNLLDTETT
jgi:hypothetical protein